MFKTVAEDIKSMVSSSKQEIPHSLQHLLIRRSVIRILQLLYIYVINYYVVFIAVSQINRTRNNPPDPC